MGGNEAKEKIIMYSLRLSVFAVKKFNALRQCGECDRVAVIDLAKVAIGCKAPVEILGGRSELIQLDAEYSWVIGQAKNDLVFRRSNRNVRLRVPQKSKVDRSYRTNLFDLGLHHHTG